MCNEVGKSVDDFYFKFKKKLALQPCSNIIVDVSNLTLFIPSLCLNLHEVSRVCLRHVIVFLFSLQPLTSLTNQY